MKAGTIVEQAKAASKTPSTRCRASRYPLKQSQISRRRRDGYSCPACGCKAPNFDTLSYSTIYCLNLDGSHQHLISEEVDSIEESQKDLSDLVQMAVIVMVVTLAPEQSQARLDQLPDWDRFSPCRYWCTDTLDGPKRHHLSARCHPLEQKINIPRLTSNGLLYEIELPVPVFVSMAVRGTHDLDSIVFGSESSNGTDDVVDNLIERYGLRRQSQARTTETD